MARINSGILNEEAMVEAINGKRFDQLNRNLQYNRKILFDGVEDNSLFLL